MKSPQPIHAFLFSLALLLFACPVIKGGPATEKVRCIDAEKKGVTIFRDKEDTVLEFHSSTPDKVTHVSFKLYRTSTEAVSGGTKTTKSTTRAHFEVDIPPGGTGQFKNEPGLHLVQILNISHFAPPKTSFPPTK